MKKGMVFAALSLSVALAGCAGPGSVTPSPAPASNAGGQQKQPAAEESNGPKTVKFGGSAKFSADPSATMVVTIGAPRADPNAHVDVPADGKYVFVDAKAELTEGVAGTVGEDEFSLVDANGKRYEPAPTGLDLEKAFIEFLTEEDRAANGVIAYDVPPNTDLHSLKVEWQPTDDKDKPLGLAATWSA